jgi:hypothetical protein
MVVNRRDQTGRLFFERDVADVRLVLESNGLTAVWETITSDGMGREGIQWMTHLFRKAT